MANADQSVVVLNGESEAALRTVGHISYALHAIVAVGAVLPGAQGSVLLLLLAHVVQGGALFAALQLYIMVLVVGTLLVVTVWPL